MQYSKSTSFGIYKMYDLFILGSSYLVPNNKEWSSNLEDRNLRFGHYGDWNALLTERSENTNTLLIFFLEDLLTDRFYSSDQLEETLGPLLQLLERSIEKSNKPIIASISSGQNFDIVRNAKGKHYLQKSFIWLKNRFEELAEKYEQFYILDLNDVFGEFGNSKAFDSRNWCFAHCRLSPLGIRSIAKSADLILTRHYAAPSKVLVLDCDNTIWGGVIGEDELDGIILGQDGIGQAFVDFQKEVKSLIDQGIIVVLSSKNNENEVWEVFKKHQNMVLTRDDIVAWKINWSEKFQNVKEMASELDLGLDSFVFWDDNPVEQEKMRVLAPEVKTVAAPSEVYEWPNLLRSLFDFAKFSTTRDDASKTTLYQKRAKFVRDSSGADDELSYLKSIRLSPKIHYFDRSNIVRAAQLCSKTNQFNLRSMRYSVDELLSISNANNGLCFLVSLEDIYGHHGTVGLVCMQKLNKDTAFLDTFLMSCRVLGRHLESWMLAEALAICRCNGIKTLIGSFIASQRNYVAASFLSDNGFTDLDLNKNEQDLHSSISIQKGESWYMISTSTVSMPFGDIYA